MKKFFTAAALALCLTFASTDPASAECGNGGQVTRLKASQSSTEGVALRIREVVDLQGLDTITADTVRVNVVTGFAGACDADSSSYLLTKVSEGYWVYSPYGYTRIRMRASGDGTAVLDGSFRFSYTASGGGLGYYLEIDEESCY